MPNALPDAAVARFKQDVERLLTAEPRRLGVAVSGGPDSLAMLLLCAAAFPEMTEAATFDHRLRAESSREAESVAALCAQLGVPHQILVPASPVEGNVSDWARAARYQALERWADVRGLDAYMTAHHADDQLETMIMRLNRGSGVSGLSGIRLRHLCAIRPLLAWRHSELVEVVSLAGIEAVEDPSNRDDRYDRARLRKALATAQWLDPVAATLSATALSEADDALDWTAAAYFERRTAAKDGVLSFDPKHLPAELLRRVTLRCLRTFVPQAAPRGDELSRLITGLSDGRTATLAGVRCTGGTFWLFSAAAPRRKN